METLVRAWADEIEITPIRAAIVSPGAMRTRMRAAAYPGEDPESVPLPAEIAPLILELSDPGKVPPLETVHFPDWKLKAAQFA
jgi:NAD(P)-dependent dehydrogenase (short-subunit alcohol dehydrogenase family)